MNIIFKRTSIVNDGGEYWNANANNLFTGEAKSVFAFCRNKRLFSAQRPGNLHICVPGHTAVCASAVLGKLSAAAVTGDNAVRHFTARTKIAFALRFSADRASDQIAKSAACNRA